MPSALGARFALLLSLTLAWLNLLLTTRWAHVPGSVNGPKRPFYVLALVTVSLLAWRARPFRVVKPAVARFVCAGAVAFLLFAFFRWFPPGTWTAIPFLDDWPPRFVSTMEGIGLLAQGRFSGWRWTFLGGYPIPTDVTQDLTVWAAGPVWIFGPAFGFHVTHLLLFVLIPVLVWADLRMGGEEDDIAWTGAGLAALFSANFSYFLIRSGDTNSLTGLVSALMVLVCAHGARRGRRWAPLALVVALTLTNHSHRGFFVYALVFLAVDAVVAWDWRSGVRGAIAACAALAASLPLTWDLWRYPSWFIANNVELHPAGFAWLDFLRKVYYNVELLLRPGRWFNDFTGLVNVFLPVILFVAWKSRGRVRFYALATLGVVALVRLNYASFGYAFLRPIILLPVFVAPALAWFVARQTGRRALAIALLAMFALYIQVWLSPVPHVRSVREFNPDLVDRLGTLDGNLVLIENAFHRDVDVSVGRTSLPTPFTAHYEALLPAVTGQRFYGGMWDGWQWTPYRDEVFANGTFKGHALDEVPPEEFKSEMRRWGIRHLVVWSDRARQFLHGAGGFMSRWESGTWSDFEFLDADIRSVVTAHGSGVLTDTTASGAVVRLDGVKKDDEVIVRTHYHPAWDVQVGANHLAVLDRDGQLAFIAPADGSYAVRLVYPGHRWLLAVGAAAIVLALGFMRLAPARGSDAASFSDRTASPPERTV